MSNMSYCRFQNTAGDLADCQQALEEMIAGEAQLSRDELAAAKRLVRTCLDIASIVAEAGGCGVDDLLDYEALVGDTLDATNGKEG